MYRVASPALSWIIRDCFIPNLKFKYKALKLLHIKIRETAKMIK